MDRWSAIIAIVARDSRRTLRLATLRFAFVGLLLLELLFTIEVASNVAIPGNPSLHEFLAVASKAYAGFTILLTTAFGVGIAVSAPAMTIGRERAQNTWTLLQSAPMRSSETVLALIGGALASAAIPVMAHIPLLTFSFVLMEPGDFWPAIAAVPMCMMLCVAGAAVGTYFATLFRRTEAATTAAAVVTVICAGGLEIILRIASTNFGWTFSGGIRGTISNWVLSGLHDVSAIRQIYGVWNGLGSLNGVALSMGSLTLVVAVCFWGATHFLHRDELSIPKKRSTEVSKTRPFHPVRRLMTVTRRPISDRLNPFFVLEMRRSYLGHPLIALALIAAVAAGYLLIASVIAWPAATEPMVALTWLLMAMAMPLVAGMTAMSSTIARERESNTFDPVALTTHTPHQILRGKLAAAGLQTLPWISVVILSFTPFWFLGGQHYGMFAACILALTVSLIVELSAGACATVVTRTVRDSRMYGRVFSVALLAGFTVLAGIVSVVDSEFGPGSTVGEDLIWLTSPLMAFGWFSFGTFEISLGETIGAKHFVLTLTLFTAMAVGLYGFALRLFCRQFPAVPSIAILGRGGGPELD